MRRLICAMLAATLLLTACSADTPPEESQGALEEYIEEYTIEESEPPPEQPDFSQELRERGSLITAAFDFEEFSVWFAVTPGWLEDARVWHIAHPSRPTIAAVVRNVDGRYILVEEIEIDIRFQPVDWENVGPWPDEIPDAISQVGNRHLVRRDGYQISNLQADLFFAGPAITVHTNEQMILVHYSFHWVRHLIFTRDGITADHALVISNRTRVLLHELENLTFSPQTGVLTLENNVYTLRADADGITETIQPTEFELLEPGELTRIGGALLDLSDWDVRLGSAIETGSRFPIINGVMYHIPWQPPHTGQVSELRLDSFELATGRQIRDRLIHDFSPETVFHRSWAARGLTVYTEAAAYLLDDNFEILHRVPWPDYIPIEEVLNIWWQPIAFNDDFTKLAFARGGLYLLDLTTDAPPVLLQGVIPINLDLWEEGRWDWVGGCLMGGSSPVLFLDDYRLFVSVGFMTGWDLFQVVDFGGNVLAEIPFHVSAEYAGGFAFSNKAIVIFEVREGSYYFDFESGVLSQGDWWVQSELELKTAYIPYPNNPRTWYVSSVERREGMWGPGSEVRATILRLDFERKTAQPILTVPETDLTLISVSQNGELIFTYSGQVGSGFAIFAPARQVP